MVSLLFLLACTPSPSTPTGVPGPDGVVTTGTAPDPSRLDVAINAHGPEGGIPTEITFNFSLPVFPKPGADATLLSYGPMVRTCLEAATAAEHDGLDLEVIDLRSMSPLDVATVASSVRRTGRLVIVHEAPVFLGLGAELAARITEECFYSLEAPVLRVGGYHTPYPPSRLEEEYLPDLDRVLDAVDRAMAY